MRRTFYSVYIAPVFICSVVMQERPSMREDRRYPIGVTSGKIAVFRNVLAQGWTRKLLCCWMYKST